ncbi:MAG TPA: ROK family protein [Hyphomicrobiales bacterium]|nr:ROK family protein [Hyphomicrobiales bacterium]
MTNACRVVADIGATNARFACVNQENGALQHQERYRCDDYPGLDALIRAYLAQLAPQRPQNLCLAVPAVVENDLLYLPNRNWRHSQQALRREFDLDLRFINDFTAQLYATYTLAPDEIQWLGPARQRSGAIRAAVGPGTGLGVKALTPTGDLVPAEGGHVAWAPLDTHEIDLLRLFHQRYARVSVERLTSGPGLSLLYWGNSILAGREAELEPEAVSAGALDGDPLCRQAVTDFIKVLGATAGDLALILAPFDGLFLMGDLLNHLAPLYDPATLRARFDAKGRYATYCAGIPLALVQAQDTGLRGCAEFLRRHPAST